MLIKITHTLEKISRNLEVGQYELPFYYHSKQFVFNSLKFQSIRKQQIVFGKGSLSVILRLVEILSIVRELLMKKQLITKRNLFYKLVKYYKHYSVIDEDIDILCWSLKISRESMNIISSSKCLIFGKFAFQIDQRTIIGEDLTITNMPSFKELEKCESKSKHLIIIEKESVFFQLYQYLIGNKKLSQPKKQVSFLLEEALVITAKGYPDSTTRAVINQLYEQFESIYYVGDYDVYGFDIFLCYLIGNGPFQTISSKTKWIQNEKLLTQGCISQQQMKIEKIPFSKEDVKKVKEIYSRKYFSELDAFDPKSQIEASFKQKIATYKLALDEMVEGNYKIELESYLKLLPEDWLSIAINSSMYL